MAVKIYNVGVSNIRVREQGVFTGPELVTDAGLYIESAGGYYAGANIIVGSKEYAIIVAPKELGETVAKWKTSQTNTAGANSTFDGKANMAAIEAAGISNHPAANFCANLSINGFDDWHLPAPDELEVCYRYLKPDTTVNYQLTISLHNSVNGTNPSTNPIGAPYNDLIPTQTSIEIYQQGGTQSFYADLYWTSMQHDTTQSWYGRFANGLQDKVIKDFVMRTRAVRWLEV